MQLSGAMAGAALGAGLLAAVWAHGHGAGRAACEARHAALQIAEERRLFRLAEELSRAAADLETAREALRARALEAEDAARADPDPCRVPAPDSLQRLRQRWSAG